jgi:predicted DNA-binding transcriptional regulator AlpA
MTKEELDELKVAIASAVSIQSAAMLTGAGVRAYLGGMGRTAFYRMIANGFPNPCSIEGGKPRWRRADVDAWIAKRKTVRVCRKAEASQV